MHLHVNAYMECVAMKSCSEVRLVYRTPGKVSKLYS